MDARMELRRVGAMMANTMFNLAQQQGAALTADQCDAMKKLSRDWDQAVGAVVGEDAQRKPDGYRLRTKNPSTGEFGPWFQTDEYFYNLFRKSPTETVEVQAVYAERRAGAQDGAALAATRSRAASIGRSRWSSTR